MKVIKQLLVVAFFLGLLAIANWAHRKILSTRTVAPTTSSDRERSSPDPVVPTQDPLMADRVDRESSQPSPSSTPPSNETSNSFADVASIIHAHCSHCHFEDGSAPFALVTYKDIAKRAEQIVEVTQSGYMPPWLPSKTDYAFSNDRSLPRSESELLKRWVAAGAKPDSQPLVKQWEPPKTDWQLGPPDLVLTLQQPYTLPASGPEVFWNFVLSGKTPKNEFVQAAEIKPGNARAVHHVIGLVDRTGAARRQQERAGENGFPGMEVHQAEILPGQSMLWSPGRVASLGTPGISWPFDRHTDIVLQMHMFPSGKEEQVQPQVGLYFADSPPTLHPLSIMLEAPSIDIPAGDSNYRVTDEILLPVDVKLLSLYPHAHYIGSTVECIARLPDESTRTLLRIDEWDFSWQDEYQFEQPVELPHGTLVTMNFTYDNSADNVRNPNDPPQRVVLGSKTTDEMGSLLLQVLVDSEREHAALDESRWQQKLLTSPLHPTANQNLGNIYESRGELNRALKHYRRVLQVSPDNSVAHDNVASVLSAKGDVVGADSHFRKAVDADPANAIAFNHWGAALMRRDRFEEAASRLNKAISIWPEFPEASVNLGEVELRRGNVEAAKEHFRTAIENAPTYALAHFNLGTILMNEQDFSLALRSFQAAIQCNDEFAEAYNNLGICHFQREDLEAAVSAFRRSIALDPNNISALQNLKTVENRLSEPIGK